MASDKIMTTKEAAAFLSVSVRKVCELIASEELVGVKVGTKYRTTESACLAYVLGPRETKKANAGEHDGDNLCQSPSEEAYGTVISIRRQEKELGDLLKRGTKSKLRSSTIS